MAELGRLAPALDSHLPIREQLPAVPFEHLLSRAVARPGDAAPTLRTAMYELMGLPEPGTPATLLPLLPAVPEPPAWGNADRPALWSRVELGDPVSVERFPAAVRAEPPDRAHLVVDDTEPDDRFRDLAAVLVRRADVPGRSAGRTTAEVFAAHPACRCVVEPPLLHLRDGQVIEVEGDAEVAGSIVHAWLRDGGSLAGLPPSLGLTVLRP
jgi:hypothetical protein